MFEKKFRCPFCYQEHTEKDCVYRCLSTNPCRFGVKINEARQIDSKQVAICRKKCDQRFVTLCPTLLNGPERKIKPIPPRAIVSDDISLALLGARSSGKSNYIAVLVNEIKNNMSWTYNCSLTACDDTSDQNYKSMYWNRVYKEKSVMDATASNDDTGPLIFSLDFYAKGKTGKIDQSILLPLYDTAGENMEREESIAERVNYIRYAGGIILLLDPFEIEEVCESVKGSSGVKIPDTTSEAETILERIRNLLQRDGNAKSGIDVPIAVVVTKLDLLLNHTPYILPDNPLRMPSRHSEGAFCLSEQEAINRSIENLLKTFANNSGGRNANLRNMLQLLDSFKYHAFFACSSFGFAPENTKLHQNIQPIRVLDPLLWLLSINKVIKTVK